MASYGCQWPYGYPGLGNSPAHGVVANAPSFEHTLAAIQSNIGIKRRLTSIRSCLGPASSCA
jgi:hypothetical protein